MFKCSSIGCENKCNDFYCTECIQKERERYVAHLKKDDLPKASDMTTEQLANYQGLTQEDLELERKLNVTQQTEKD